jgi:hypothetical protein
MFLYSIRSAYIWLQDRYELITTHSFFGPAVYMRIKQHIFTYLPLKGQIGKFTVFIIVLSAEILIACINQASLMHNVILEVIYKIVR